MSAPVASTIRRAGPADAPLVHDLVHAAYAEWVDVLGRLPMPMRADYERAVVAHAVDLLEVDDTPVALIETVRAADAMLIVNVAVAPGARKHGHGRTLLAHAERVAATHGLHAVTLYTNKLMRANIALYRRLGYAIEREEETETVGTVVHMRKAL